MYHSDATPSCLAMDPCSMLASIPDSAPVIWILASPATISFLVIYPSPVLSFVLDSAPVIWILASPPSSWKFLWQNTAYLVTVFLELQGTFAMCLGPSFNIMIHNICKVMFKDEIFTSIQIGCNLVQNSSTDLQTLKILSLNNLLPIGLSQTHLFSACVVINEFWQATAPLFQPLLLVHRSLVRLFWSFTWNINAQVLHLGRCECEFDSTMAWEMLHVCSATASSCSGIWDKTRISGFHSLNRLSWFMVFCLAWIMWHAWWRVPNPPLPSLPPQNKNCK